jgi:MoaA/NifB/PqqE/SkfB family radical SAM enzyme
MISNSKQLNQFTSTGAKFFYHQEALEMLKGGWGKPITAHLMPTDICNSTCAFCSVLTRAGKSITMDIIKGFLAQLTPLGLKSVIISGGGNPILFRDKGFGFNDLVNYIYDLGLEIGLITNGMPMKDYGGRMSWKTVSPETLDKLKWIRISMSGLDHKELEVFVPDIDNSKTTLGFSYVYHDIYYDDAEPNHGKVSSLADLITPLDDKSKNRVVLGKDRLPWIQDEIGKYVRKYNPKYVRLLPNCLEVDKISERCEELDKVARAIDPNVVFVQYKPPESPNVCYLGYLHPVLNSDGYVYPCDSVVLNIAANHAFAKPWRVCQWDEIGELYKKPVQSLIKDPRKLCPGCVFHRSNNLLEKVRNGMATPMPTEELEHPNFI